MLFVDTSLGGQLPVRQHEGDAGYDLFVSQDTTVPPGSFLDVHTGICVQMPPSVWGLLTGRSSTLRKKGLLVYPGIIDNGYRGELFIAVQNLSMVHPVQLAEGDRIGQLILMSLVTHDVAEVAALQPSDRGNAGFGSTGD